MLQKITVKAKGVRSQPNTPQERAEDSIPDALWYDLKRLLDDHGLWNIEVAIEIKEV